MLEAGRSEGESPVEDTLPDGWLAGARLMRALFLLLFPQMIQQIIAHTTNVRAQQAHGFLTVSDSAELDELYVLFVRTLAILFAQ